MITYDGIPCELDDSASGMELVLPLPESKDPRPGLLLQLRLTMPETVPDRGDFIGQDVLLLLRPAIGTDIEHWENLDGYSYEPPRGLWRQTADRLLCYPEPVAGHAPDPEMLNAAAAYRFSLRAVGTWSYYLELEASVLPVPYASQQLFGWGPDKPSDEALHEMYEELRILEILPLWRVQVLVPPGLADAPAWAAEQAARWLGLTRFQWQPGGRCQALKFPDSGYVPDPPPVSLYLPWADVEHD